MATNIAVPSPTNCRVNIAHMRQPRPDPGLGFQVNALRPSTLNPKVISSLGSGLLLSGAVLYTLEIVDDL